MAEAVERAHVKAHEREEQGRVAIDKQSNFIREERYRYIYIYICTYKGWKEGKRQKMRGASERKSGLGRE